MHWLEEVKLTEFYDILSLTSTNLKMLGEEGGVGGKKLVMVYFLCKVKFNKSPLLKTLSYQIWLEI